MRRFAVLAGLALTLSGTPLQAQDPLAGTGLENRQTLGTGRLFSNDFLGDGQDRWRTGSYQLSVLRGTGWDGVRPTRPGTILEYRLRTEIIAPSTGTGPLGDRPYVGALSIGVHTPFAAGPFEASFGVDVTAIGPQTGLSDFQTRFHDRFDIPGPIGTAAQLGDDVLLTGTAELAWPVRLSALVTLRPFAESQAGVEDLVRLGSDIIVGTIGHADLLVRDSTTGQLIRAIEAPGQGSALVFGGDWARVSSSAYLPQEQGFSARDERFRLRAGVHWQLAERISLFYGLTYLSEEFDGPGGGPTGGPTGGQTEGQLLGGLKLNFNF